MPNNKKKKGSRHRSAAVVYCEMCKSKLAGTQTLRCVCTRVNFCDQRCLSKALQTGKHVCPGAPSNTNRMRPESAGPSPLDDPDVKAEWEREYNETIMKPLQQIYLLKRVRTKPGPEFYARLADEEGSGPCAYMAGVLYKNRLLGGLNFSGQGGVESSSSNRLVDRVLKEYWRQMNLPINTCYKLRKLESV